MSTADAVPGDLWYPYRLRDQPEPGHHRRLEQRRPLALRLRGFPLFLPSICCRPFRFVVSFRSSSPRPSRSIQDPVCPLLLSVGLFLSFDCRCCPFRLPSLHSFHFHSFLASSSPRFLTAATRRLRARTAAPSRPSWSYGPSTHTIMQVYVRPTTPAPAFDEGATRQIELPKAYGASQDQPSASVGQRRTTGVSRPWAAPTRTVHLAPAVASARSTSAPTASHCWTTRRPACCTMISRSNVTEGGCSTRR